MSISWDEIAPDFHRITSRVVWCTVTTVDAKGRPRARIAQEVEKEGVERTADRQPDAGRHQ